MTVRPDIRYPGPTLTTRLQWLLKAGPSDHLLALSVASASLPVIGKHLEPLGALTAAGIWGARHAPDMIGATAKSLFTPKDPANAEIKRQERESTTAVTEAALRGVVAAKDLEIEWPSPSAPRRSGRHASTAATYTGPPSDTAHVPRSCSMCGAATICLLKRHRCCCSSPVEPGCTAVACCRAMR